MTKRTLERVHIDHFFFGDKIFLVLVDDYSNWIDVKLNRAVSSECVIRALKEFIVSMGLPEMIVSDNATCFNSSEFESFCKSNHIKHVNSPQYHPESNGLAERCVGIVKENLRKCLRANSRLSMEDQLLNFLFEYRGSPLAQSGNSPASNIFKYNFRNNLNCLSKQVRFDSCNQDAEWESQTTTTISSLTPAVTKACKAIQFSVNDNVYYYHKLRKLWVRSQIVSKISQNLYKIKLETGQVLNSHISFLKKDKTEIVKNSILEERSNSGPLRHQIRLRSHVR